MRMPLLFFSFSEQVLPIPLKNICASACTKQNRTKRQVLKQKTNEQTDKGEKQKQIRSNGRHYQTINNKNKCTRDSKTNKTPKAAIRINLQCKSKKRWENVKGKVLKQK